MSEPPKSAAEGLLPTGLRMLVYCCLLQLVAPIAAFMLIELFTWPSGLNTSNVDSLTEIIWAIPTILRLATEPIILALLMVGMTAVFVRNTRYVVTITAFVTIINALISAVLEIGRLM